MWYPSQQQHQQQSWRGYVHHLPRLQQQQQQQQQAYSGTLYYCGTNEAMSTNQTSTYMMPRSEENESFGQYQSTGVEDTYVTETDYNVTNSTGSYGDEMLSSSSLPYQNSTTHWNPVIVAPARPSTISNSAQPNRTANSTSSSSSSSSACWDWLLYPPEIYSHLYVPSSSFVQQQQQDDDLDLLASLPSWLLVLLEPSMYSLHRTDDENDSDQEISSLPNHLRDEPLLSMNIEKKIIHVSSNSFLSSENPLKGQKSQENRSSTPDTDDGYQSASDASRSDYSQPSLVQYDHHPHLSKDAIRINVPSSLMPKRISYAAAVKPITAPMNKIIANNRISPLASASIKMKNNSSSLPTTDMLNTTGQKLKFTAPRFERMHHAKQYSSSTATTTMTIKDPSPILPLTSFTNRGQIRSNNTNNNQRNHIAHSTRRR